MWQAHLQLVQDVAGVHLDGHEGHQLAAVGAADLPPHHLCVLHDEYLFPQGREAHKKSPV